MTFAQKAAMILDNKKAVDIVPLDVAHLTVLTDEMLIASGRSSVQVRAMCDELEEKLSVEGIEPIRTEGYTDGRWIILDYGNLIVHLFHKEDREYYGLDRLWTDGNNVLPVPESEEEAENQ